MSQTADISFVTQFQGEVHEAYQRQGSLLRSTVRTQTQVVGEKVTFQKVGKGSASQKTRHGKVPVMNINHEPVECPLADYFAGDWVDKFDELKMKHNEREVTANAGAWALGRKTDELIIASLDSATTYQDSWNLSATALANLTDVVTTLGDRDLPMMPGSLFGVVSWQLWNKLLNIDAFNKSDYVGNDLPLKQMMGEARMWMGVVWFPHSGLTKASNVRKNFVYHKSAIGHAIGADVQSDVTWHGDYHSWFVNHAMSQGSCLIDTEGVQQFLVTENA